MEQCIQPRQKCIVCEKMFSPKNDRKLTCSAKCSSIRRQQKSKSNQLEAIFINRM